MKKSRPRFTSFVPWRSVALVFLLSAPSLSRAITLTGANGKAVAFHLIKEATPKGLTAQLAADGPVIGVTWDKLDLKAVARDQPLIFAAYERAMAGETIALDLGEAMGGAPAGAAEAAGAAPKADSQPASRFPGWLDTKVGKIEFMLQMPLSTPRGILLVSLDDYGHSFRYLAGNDDRGKGPWAEFLTKQDFAILSYDVESADEAADPTKIDDFVFADKGSGRALESALGSFATKLKKPELTGLPIAIYGAERTGAAFAYSYLHYKPEKVLAAVICKGGFYDSAPRPETVKIPVLFLWGEYCKNHELWASENHAESVLAKAAPLKPNWTNGREFRGNSDPNPELEYFGRRYLLEMIKMRLPVKTGSNAAAPDGEGATAAEASVLTGIDRSKGYRGNVETAELLKLDDPEAALGEEETFLPNEAVGNLWKKFVMGELEAPMPGQPK